MKFNLLATPAWRRELAVVAAPVVEIADRKTVFIIEDDPENLRLMRLALAGETYRIETACSAEAAVRRLAASPPALILLSTEVLAADGTSLVRRLLADGQLISVPIVVLTETGISGNPEPGRYDGQIGKPINPETFPGEVRAFVDSLSQAPSTPPAEPIVPGAATGDRRTQVGNLLDAIEAGLPDSQFGADTRPSLRRLAEAVGDLKHPDVADYLQQAERIANAATVRGRSRFRSVVHHCRELLDLEANVTPGLAELCAGYLDRRRAEMSNLERWLRNSDFAALGKAGHNLKGTGAAYGFGELTDLGRALEAAAKKPNATAIVDLLTQIESYIDIVRPTPD